VKEREREGRGDCGRRPSYGNTNLEWVVPFGTPDSSRSSAKGERETETERHRERETERERERQRETERDRERERQTDREKTVSD
jgi:hypothetical protein